MPRALPVEDLLRREAAAVDLIERGEDGPLMLALVVWPPAGPLAERAPEHAVCKEGRLWPPEARVEALRLVGEGCNFRQAAWLALGRDDRAAAHAVGRWAKDAAGARSRQAPAVV